MSSGAECLNVRASFPREDRPTRISRPPVYSPNIDSGSTTIEFGNCFGCFPDGDEITETRGHGNRECVVQGIANVKVSSQEGLLENAAERFLHVPHAQIGQIAKETLEGNLRGVVATLTPEEVNEDRLKFADTLVKHAKDDLEKIGLELDVLGVMTELDVLAADCPTPTRDGVMRFLRDDAGWSLGQTASALSFLFLFLN